MHVPKSAGTSFRIALAAALPPGSLSPKQMEPSSFHSFRAFDRLGPDARAVVAANDEEIRALADHPAVFGHFSLATLAALTPPSRIGTVVREPRARLLSHYLYLRLSVSLRTTWAAYGIHTAAEQPLTAFLTEPRVAPATDNSTCRMLLHGDPRIRDAHFIPEAELASVAEAAWERLDELGFVGMLEAPDAAWRGLGALFGVDLSPARQNVIGEGEIQPEMLPVPSLGGAEALELVERRTAADAVLYERIARRFAGGEEAARRLADAAFAEQLVRYGSFTCTK